MPPQPRARRPLAQPLRINTDRTHTQEQPVPKQMTNAERVIATIKAKRIRSVDDLADALGISRTTVYAWLGQVSAAGYEIANGRMLPRWKVLKEPSEAE